MAPRDAGSPALVALIGHGDCGRHDTGWGHPEHTGRLRAVTRAIRDDHELFAALDHREGRHATVDELCLVHDRRYVESVRDIALAGGGTLDPDTVASEGSWDAATAAAGCALDAVDLAMSGEVARSFCAVRPPGHHAMRDRAMGFCLFGTAALAARYARDVRGAQRVLIADWDVHHGNGTQALVQHDPGIHFVSMHQWPFYPGTGRASDRGAHGNVWNVPLPPGLPRSRYMDEFERAFESAMEGFDPDLIVVSAGFDSLAGDPIGGFTLEVADMAALTQLVLGHAGRSGHGRVVSVLEGGYAPELLGKGVAAHLRALAGLPALA